MTNEEKICVKVLLNSLILALKEIIKLNNGYRKKLETTNEIILFKIDEDISFVLEIRDGKIDNRVGPTSLSPTITIEINEIATALKILTGNQNFSENDKNINVSGDTEKFQQINFIFNIGKYMETKEFQIKMNFYRALLSFEEVSKKYKDLQEFLKKFKCNIQFNVCSFKGYLIIEDGKLISVIDKKIENPNVTISVKDIDIAQKLFSGDLDILAPYISGGLKIRGNMLLGLFFLQEIIPYISRLANFLFYSPKKKSQILKSQIIKQKLKRNFILSCLPVTIVGANVRGKPNFMTIGLFGVVEYIGKLVVQISSGAGHYTNIGIRKNKTFSVNFPSEEMLQITDYIGVKSGKNIDKSNLFNVFYGILKNAPMIKEAPVCYECKLIHTLNIGTVHKTYYGEVIKTYANEDIYANGLNINNFHPLLLWGQKYYSIGNLLGTAFSLGRFFKPIK